MPSGQSHERLNAGEEGFEMNSHTRSSGTDSTGDVTRKNGTTDAKLSSEKSRLNADEKQPEDGTKADEKDSKEKPPGLGNYFRIFTFCDRLDVVLYAVGITASIASGAALPLMTILFGSFTRRFNDFSSGSADPSEFRDGIDTFVLWFVYLFVGRLVASYVANMAVSVAAIRTTRSIRKALLECTLRREIWHFDKETTGSIASQVTTNGDKINHGIAEKLASIIQSISMFWSAFIVALVLQWKLTLITMTLIPGIVLILGIGVSIDAKQEAEIVKIHSKATVLAQEALSSIKMVHAFWAHEKIVSRYEEFLTAAHEVGKKKSPNVGIVHVTQQFCTLAGTALSFWQGFRMFQSGEIENAGAVLTVVLSVLIATTAMLQLTVYLGAIANASSAAAELFSLMEKPSALDPLSTDGEKPAESQGDIQFRNVDFAYPSRPSAQVLQGFDLSIPAGKTTALVGASGCGKSTVVGLLERWYVQQSGEILLDGKDLATYNTKWIRSNIRLVQQEPVLFRGTVFDNVAKGLVGPQRELSSEDQMQLVQDACKSSNAHDFIKALPQGYLTQVGERASMLSGGQKQRIAIARSIISDPKVLLLDEATSALDPRAEGIVQDALRKVSVNKTTLVIAHKLATIKEAHNIVLVSQGQVVEQGTHEELIMKDGRYAALVRAQDLGDGKGERKPYELQQDTSADEILPESSGPQEKAAGQHSPEESMNISLLSSFITLMGEQRSSLKLFLMATPAIIIGGGVYPAQALLFSRLINVFILPHDEAKDKADFFSLMFFIVALATALGYFVIGWSVNLIMQAATHRYRSELFNLLMRLDASFFDEPNHASGALASKLTSVPASLQELISVNIVIVMISVVSLLSCSILAIAHGWKLGLVVVLVGLPFIVGSGFARVRLETKMEKQNTERFATTAALATEAVTAIRTVASLTMEEQIRNEYGAILNDIAKSSIRSLAFTILGLSLSQSLEFLVMALGFWYGSRLIASGEYTSTQFFVVFLAVVFGGQAAGQISGYVGSMASAQNAANYLFWLRSLQSPFDEQNIGTDDSKPPSDGPIQVDNVEFTYKQRESSRVLNGINMMIAPGSHVACVGPSGCGKSTFISLLERLYDPTEGRILWDNIDIKSMSLRLFRGRLSLVQQEPTLFEGSVRDNISLGVEHQPSDEEILEASRQANAHEFISSLPEGLNTFCGSGGLQFSGGQRQRIAIARALIRKPQVLLLDEATSALDTENERIVQKTLEGAASNRTTIAVAHRLSTIRNSDCIFVFADGKILEQGTHEELLQLRGQYYEMCLAQSLDREA